MNYPKSISKAKGLSVPKQNKKKNAGPGPGRVAVVNQQKQVKIGQPQMSTYSASDGSIRVRHREYVADIAGSVAFSCLSYSINPGLTTVANWLASIAANFESYAFVKLGFEFETMKSTSTNGSLMMVIDFDAADGVPASKQTFMNFNHATRSPVWSECRFEADHKESSKLGPSRYVRTGALAANLDIKTYDVGNFLIAVQGCADTSTLGELYFVYDIILQSPVVGANNPGALAYYSKSILSAGASIARSTPFGNSPTVSGSLSGSVTNTTITFDIAGQYLISMHATGTSITAIPVLTLTGATCPNSGVIMPTLILASGAEIECTFLMTVSAGGSVLFNFTASAATITACSCFITPIQGSVFS